MSEINCFETGFEKAVELSEKHKISLHPKFIYYWTQISKEQFNFLIDWLNCSWADKKIILPWSHIERDKFVKGKRALELLGIPHEISVENVLISRKDSKSLFVNLGLDLTILDKEGFIEIKPKTNPRQYRLTSKGVDLAISFINLENSERVLNYSDKTNRLTDWILSLTIVLSVIGLGQFLLVWLQFKPF